MGCRWAETRNARSTCEKVHRWARQCAVSVGLAKLIGVDRECGDDEYRPFCR
jgi:hypothetical protein